MNTWALILAGMNNNHLKQHYAKFLKEATMDGKKFIFIAGLHRSGTSLVHEILRSHPDISGFSNTGVPQDEGQHLQDIFLPAKALGGPGRFGFNPNSFMDEQHFLATPANAYKLYQEWSNYWNTDREYLIEKSPPTLVRTRFFQRLFPQSIFIIILRHPIAVSYATQKWSKTSIVSLLEHTLRCYERFMADMPFLHNVYVLRYEEFVKAPEEILQSLLRWIGIKHMSLDKKVVANINEKYFKQWEADRRNIVKKIFWPVSILWRKFEKRANVFGYSIYKPEALLPAKWLGTHNTNPHPAK